MKIRPLLALCVMAAAAFSGSCRSYVRSELDRLPNYTIQREYTSGEYFLAIAASPEPQSLRILVYTARLEKVSETRWQESRRRRFYTNWGVLREMLDWLLLFTSPISVPIAYSNNAGEVQGRSLSEFLFYDLLPLVHPLMNSSISAGKGEYSESTPGPLVATDERRQFLRRRPVSSARVRLSTSEQSLKLEATSGPSGVAEFELPPDLRGRIEVSWSDHELRTSLEVP